MNKILKLATA